jgi:hypothetical protein
MSQAPVFVHLLRGEQRLGPYELDQVNAYTAEGRLYSTDLARCEGQRHWQPLPMLLRKYDIAPPPGRETEWNQPIPGTRLAVTAAWTAALGILVVPAPVAVVLGGLALHDLRRHPGKLGWGRAWFAVIFGGLITVALVAGLILFRLRTRH